MERPIQITLGQDGRLTTTHGLGITRVTLDISYVGSIGAMQPVNEFMALRINGSVFIEIGNASLQYVGPLHHDGQPCLGVGRSKITLDLSVLQLELIEQQRRGGSFTLWFDLHGHALGSDGVSTYLVPNGLSYRVEAAEWAEVLTRSGFSEMLVLLPRTPAEHATENCLRAYDAARSAARHLENGLYRNAVAEGRSAIKRLADELGETSNTSRNRLVAERFAAVAQALLSVANAANHTEEDPLDDHNWTREEAIALLGPLFALLGYVTARPSRVP